MRVLCDPIPSLYTISRGIVWIFRRWHVRVLLVRIIVFYRLLELLVIRWLKITLFVLMLRRILSWLTRGIRIELVEELEGIYVIDYTFRDYESTKC